MSTYQDVVAAKGAAAAWALTESSGLSFAPYIGGSPLVGNGTFVYRTTGPFATSFGLQLNVGAKLALAFLQNITVPISIECWYKFTSPPASDQYLLYSGAAASNGGGYYVAHATGHIHIFIAVGHDFDTGVAWPTDGAWHLFTAVQQNAVNVQSLYIDGVNVWSGFTQVPSAPSPNTMFFGGENGSAAVVSLQVAMPALYIRSLTNQEISNTELAATDPNAAIVGATSTNGLLASILASVRKTF